MQAQPQCQSVRLRRTWLCYFPGVLRKAQMRYEPFSATRKFYTTRVLFPAPFVAARLTRLLRIFRPYPELEPN